MKNFFKTFGLGVQGSGRTSLLHGVLGLWYNHFAIFTEYFDVCDQLGEKFFFFSLFFQVIVFLLCLFYSGCEWIDGVLFVLLGKHKVHGFLGVG